MLLFWLQLMVQMDKHKVYCKYRAAKAVVEHLSQAHTLGFLLHYFLVTPA